jgi:hypothetical protein
LAPALFAVATLALSAPVFVSAAVAQISNTAQEESPAVIAARDYLQATGYRLRLGAKLAAIAKSKVALKIMVEHVPAMEDQVVKIYAARFSAEELREASKFFRTATGVLYFNFNTEMNTNPYTTAEIYRNEVAKRFTVQQRAEVFAYVSSSVGKKMQRLLPELVKAENDAAAAWGHDTQKDIDRAIRAGEEVS